MTMKTQKRILLCLGLFSLALAHGEQARDHGEGFLIGFAMSDFVTERGDSGSIDKVALHGLCWFPPKESSDGFFMGHVTLDRPITPEQYKILMAVREKHGAEQVYFKFAARRTEGSEFQGKLLGYYPVTYEEREGFLGKLDKDRQTPGFVPIAENEGEREGTPSRLLSAVIVAEGESRGGVARSEAMTITDAGTLERLEAHFPKYQDRPSSEISGGWERGYRVYFNLADGRTLSATVSENGGGATWSMGHGDLRTNGKFTEFVDSLRKE